MSRTEGDNASMGVEPVAPDFERIVSKLSNLVSRSHSVREESVFISDALIGVQNTGAGLDDSAKPTSPEYFVIKCFDLLSELDDELERLEIVNARLLSSVKSM